MSNIEFSLPLENPVLIFSVILFIILFAPILLNKLKIPHLLGLIIAGAIIGPNGFHLLDRDSSIILFGTVGLLYIMFLAGLEIDMGEFKKNSGKSLIFGLYTFFIPLILCFSVSYYLLGFRWEAAVLIGGMFAAHTLIAYPIVSKMGVAKNRAVNISIGSTLIADLLSLLVLAAMVGVTSGEVGKEFWIRLGISVVVFAVIILWLFPLIGRWFFKRFNDSISQYIFVLGMVFLGAFLAEAAGVEGIIGAFLAGLALNRLIPHTSPLMNRIEFVGNALFIPFFLIGVGMLIDYKAFFKDFETIIVATAFIVTATVSKYIAAWLGQKSFGFSDDERRIMFGLSNARVAATLAAVLVGYKIIMNPEAIEAAQAIGIEIQPIRLLSESVLNGTILSILVTSTIASFSAQKGALNLAGNDAAESGGEEGVLEERILIPVRNMETTEELVNLGMAVKSKKNQNALVAINIIDNNTVDKASYRQAKKLLRKATEVASSADNQLTELLRYDLNVVNALTSVVKEHRITDMIMGLHAKSGITDTFLGNLTEGILSNSNSTTMIYHCAQPLATLKRHLVVVPEKAEKEIGFPFWLLKVWNLAKNTGSKLVFYAHETTLAFIKNIHADHPVSAEFKLFRDWDDFLVLTSEVQPNDNLIIVLSRKDHLSYHSSMSKLPQHLNKYFFDYNFILVFPIQLGEDSDHNDSLNPSLEALVPNLNRFDAIGKTVTKLFKKNK